MVRVLDLEAPERPVLAFRAHTMTVFRALFSPDGRWIVTCSKDNTARLWEASTGVPLHSRALAHDSWVYEASFSPDGRQVVTVSYDKSARLWDVKTGLPIDRFATETPMCSVQFSPDGAYFSTVCWDADSTTRTWDIHTGGQAFVPLRHTGYPVRLAYDPSGHRLAVAGADRVVRLWDLAGNTWDPPVHPVLYGEDGTRVMRMGERRLEFWDLSRKPTSAFKVDLSEPLTGAVLSKNGRYLITARPSSEPPGNDLLAQVWDTANGRPLGPASRIRRVEGQGPSLVSFSPDGTAWASAQGDTAEVWGVVTGKQLATFRQSAPVAGLSYSSQGHRLATWGGTNVFLWDVDQRSRIAVLPHPSDAAHAEFSPDGKYLVTCCTLGQLQQRYAEIWDAATGSPLNRRLLHGDGVNHASFSPDGLRIGFGTGPRASNWSGRSTIAIRSNRPGSAPMDVWS
jgi:WD40 repeat protein